MSGFKGGTRWIPSNCTWGLVYHTAGSSLASFMVRMAFGSG